MDGLLIGITAVSLLLALVMGAAVWRLLRLERARSAARVAALSAAASEPDIRAARAEPTIEHAAEPVAVGGSRGAPWAAARISPFGAPARAAMPSLRVDTVDVMRPGESSGASPTSSGFSDAFLHSAVSTPPSTARQRGLAVAALLLFVVAMGGGYWTVFGTRGSRGPAASAASTSAPLELISLRHERRGARLSVTGLVRNPAGGSPVDSLAAVVFLFDQQGAFVTSARANIDFLKLAPGDESPFVISVEAPSSVARYRVSFRTDAGVVPHVDRRGQSALATTQAGE